MCALFTLKVTRTELMNDLGGAIEISNEFETLNERHLPHQKAPVATLVDDHFQIEWMNFSLIPSWSKERRPKFATHNARIETLTEKPTWKRPLVSRHVLVPLTEFIEPIYEGEQAGYMVGFSQKEDHILWAAGLSDEWLDKSTGELIASFTIITHEPSSFVAQIGHDREPLFLGKKSFRKWADISSHQKPQDWITFLKDAHEEPDLKIRQDRIIKSFRK